MRKSHLIRTLPVLLTLSLASLAFAPSAQAAAFAKFDGIDGESKDANHENWIDLIAIQESIRIPGAAADGSTRRRGAPNFDDIVLTKLLDKSSVKLREKLAQGAIIPLLEIELTTTFGGARTTYFRYELKNVQITSFSLDASGDEGVPVTEVISVNFEEIKWTYTEFDDTGSSKGNVEATWKVEQAEP